MTVSFNLIAEPWIPCLRQDGRPVSLGLRDVLVQAHELAEVHGESPLVTAALYRLLLALLHRVYGPEDMEAWEALWRAGRWEVEPLDAYLEEWRDRFDLFHAHHPFLQVKDDRVPRHSVVDLVPPRVGYNILFQHNLERIPLRITAAEAAQLLLANQMYGLSGTCYPQKGLFYTDGPSARSMLFLLRGRSLFHTLTLNLSQYPQEPYETANGADRPMWEADDALFPERTIPLGRLDALTWPSRRIWLAPLEVDGELFVEELTISPGIPWDDAFRDPLKHCRKSDRFGWMALGFIEGKGLWRDSSALLQLSASTTRPVLALEWIADLAEFGYLHERVFPLSAVGMLTKSGKNKIESYWSETLPISIDYLARHDLVEQLQEALQQSEDTGRALQSANDRLAASLLWPEDDGDALAKRLRDRRNRDAVRRLTGEFAITRGYWSRLELPFRQLLEALPADPDTQRIAWRQTLRALAWEAFDGVAAPLEATPRQMKAVVRGREALARGIGEALGSVADAAIASPHDMTEERRPV